VAVVRESIRFYRLPERFDALGDFFPPFNTDAGLSVVVGFFGLSWPLPLDMLPLVARGLGECDPE
jgi:hypothetical protein